MTPPPIASIGWARSTGSDQVSAPWRRPDPLGQRVVLTVLFCALVIVLPFGPYRVLLALLIAVVQLITTVVVRRLKVAVTDKLGSYLLVEHVLMLVVVLVAPSGYLGIAIVAIGSLDRTVRTFRRFGSGASLRPRRLPWSLRPSFSASVRDQ